MRIPFLVLVFFSSLLFANAVHPPIESGVLHWDDLEVKTTPSGERRAMLISQGKSVSRLAMHATTLNPGSRPHPPHRHKDEEMVIVKEGKLTVTIGQRTEVIGPGEVVVVLSEEEHGWINESEEPVTYYVLRLTPHEANIVPFRKFGQSMIIDYPNLRFIPNARGGRRNFFNGSLPTLEFFEMHESILRGGLQNHPSHSHDAAEMMFLMEGEAEMEIADQRYRGTAGDVFIIASDDPHTLFALGDSPAHYYAFKWGRKSQ